MTVSKIKIREKIGKIDVHRRYNNITTGARHYYRKCRAFLVTVRGARECKTCRGRCRRRRRREDINHPWPTVRVIAASLRSSDATVKGTVETNYHSNRQPSSAPVSGPVVVPWLVPARGTLRDCFGRRSRRPQSSIYRVYY